MGYSDNVNFPKIYAGELEVSGLSKLDAVVADSITSVGAVSGTTGTFSDNVIISVAGKGLRVKEGSNARMGVSTLTAGTVTVANTSVTANTRIFLSRQSAVVPGFLDIANVVASTSFDIVSDNVADESVVAWMLVEPSA